MNHFLLPGDAGRAGPDAQRYGVHADGAAGQRPAGAAAPGATGWRPSCSAAPALFDGLSDVGALNAAFAERFLRDEGIAVVGGDLGGDRGRRIEYWPASGRARQALLAGDAAFASQDAARPPQPQGGTVELF